LWTSEENNHHRIPAMTNPQRLLALSGLSLAIALGSVTFAGQMVDQALEKREERLKNSKVGDWVEYDQTVGLDAFRTNIVNRIRVTVTQKDETSVTLKTVVAKTKEVLGEEKVVFGQPRQAKDPNKALPQEAMGWEQILVGEQDFQCQWTENEYHSRLKTGNTAIFYTEKIWTCDDVPVEGIVKSVIEIKPDDPAYTGGGESKDVKVAGSVTTRILTGFGHAEEPAK
jgi:hypothetical protein